MKNFYFIVILISTTILSNSLCLADNEQNPDPNFSFSQEQLKNKSPEESKNIIYFALLKFAKEKEQFYLKKYQITKANSPFSMQRFEDVIKKKVYTVKSVSEINILTLSEDISKRIGEVFQPVAFIKDYDSIMNSEMKSLEKNFIEIKNVQNQILAEQKKITSTLNSSSPENNQSGNGLLFSLKNNTIYINLSILVLQIILLGTALKSKL
jgi:hypothetical protein